jgi:dolichol-phosphate mannosyltransferase
MMAEFCSLDVVVPVYNEAQCIEAFADRLRTQLTALQIPYRILFVNDGSVDDTQAKLVKLTSGDAHFAAIELSRNFGHQAAITCGLEASTADWVITMDGDGEHPPEKIVEMIAKAKEGYDLVLVQRQAGQDASFFKRATSDGFYRFIGQITSTPILPGVGDFRLMNRMVVDALVSMPEYHRFLRGMVSWLGFKSAVIPYVPAKRMGGKSKYSLKKMFRLAADAIYSFSLVPVIAALISGAIFLAAAVVVGIVGLVQGAMAWVWNAGLVFLLLFCTGTILLAVGSVGMYSGKAFQQVKWRPIYVVRSRTNVSFEKGDTR